MAGDDAIDCKDHELAEFLDKALTIQVPDVINETTDIGIVRGHVQTITGKINVIMTLSADPPSPRLNVMI